MPTSQATVEASKGGLLGWLNENIEKPFLFAGLLAIILIITFQTFYRYVITQFTDGAGSAVWTEELARFIFIWISYLAASIAIKNRENIRVDFVYDRLPAKWQPTFWIVNDLCYLVLGVVVLVMGTDLVRFQIRFPQIAPALQIPYYLPYLILPIGFGLMSLRLVQDIWKEIKSAGIKSGIFAVAITAAIFAPVLFGIDLASTTILFGYFAIFLVVGVPIGISLGLASLVTLVGSGTLPVDYIAQVSFTSIDSFPIMAIPFFIAAGIFMGSGGLSTRLLTLADEMLGSLPGGMALATIATCMFFAAISGSGPATVAAIGSLTIPAMIERGYDKFFACAIVAAAGAIGVMIPPSNPFVIYGVASQSSIGKLFIAGVIPGLLTGLVLMSFSYWYSKKKGWMGEAKERSPKSIAKAFWDAKLALMVPVIVLGGIYGGLMTPTEAAAVAAFYGLFVGLFVYKGLNMSNIVGAFMEVCSTSAIVIILMAMATVFGYVMTVEQVPAKIAAFILGVTENKILILLLINVLLLIIGTFMEALAAIVILVPILLPIVTKVGVDPVHFGIIMVVNLAIGFATPPVGVNLFVASSVAKVKLAEVSKQILPILGLMILVLLAVTYIPELSLMFIGD
ncbi:TRAP transporter large permease subunit [Pseudodesulfovibrio thermohalotolerans]|uniref:TRAP transporter large permease n=1 Tax=Pseudodesulfovibrio thermohalotolerans TaxID=2880651 RepID=UPI0024411103|nr:TRAP transporter large permease subunit [Pseudodesulfovibrio thermohalotolerans]WFS61642.1 TRAP transporter large permease subunit [Pseudodesulfovibrio thermohalotolerans]